jgi:hypothetical protein
MEQERDSSIPAALGLAFAIARLPQSRQGSRCHRPDLWRDVGAGLHRPVRSRRALDASPPRLRVRARHVRRPRPRLELPAGGAMRTATLLLLVAYAAVGVIVPVLWMVFL